jgi:hypothetical protein
MSRWHAIVPEALKQPAKLAAQPGIMQRWLPTMLTLILPCLESSVGSWPPGRRDGRGAARQHIQPKIDVQFDASSNQ